MYLLWVRENLRYNILQILTKGTTSDVERENMDYKSVTSSGSGVKDGVKLGSFLWTPFIAKNADYHVQNAGV